MKHIIFILMFGLFSICLAETNESPRYATVTNSIFSNSIVIVKDGEMVEDIFGESVVYVKTNVVILKMSMTNGTKWHSFNLTNISKIEALDERCSAVKFGRGEDNVAYVTFLNGDIKKIMFMKRRLWKNSGGK